MRHLCNDTLATVVNGQFPGPPVEATEGDTVIVHLVNESPFEITIHWYVTTYILHIPNIVTSSKKLQ
jgi:laccase